MKKSLNVLNPPLWRQIQRRNWVSWEKLAEYLELTDKQKEKLLPKSSFPLNLPQRIAEKIEKQTLDDPILRQFVPLAQEKKAVEGFIDDPVGDHKVRQFDRLLHKYQGRVLLIATGACGMHCRYCFRQNFSYPGQESGFGREMTQIRSDPSIKEVILSGGDPLSLSDEKLKSILLDLEGISHVQRVRFHTRFPIGIPERITPEFLELIKELSKKIYFVFHVNHPLELDKDVLLAFKKLRQAGAVLLNQAVLLKDVNDHVETLAELSELLVDHGVIPYYLHQLDRVKGASHFEVSEEEGKKIVNKLSAMLPGYAVPRYVKEISGEPGKSLIN